MLLFYWDAFLHLIHHLLICLLLDSFSLIYKSIWFFLAARILQIIPPIHLAVRSRSSCSTSNVSFFLSLNWQGFKCSATSDCNSFGFAVHFNNLNEAANLSSKFSRVTVIMRFDNHRRRRHHQTFLCSIRQNLPNTLKGFNCIFYVIPQH